MVKEFTVMSSDKLEFGGFNTRLVSNEESGLSGLSYWAKFNAEQTVGETISINMDHVYVSDEKSSENHPIRVIRPREAI